MLSRPFIALFISVFVATLGISMVSPLLPVYAEELGASGVELGLAFSSFAIVQAIFGPITGRLSDRYPRKPFIVAGLCIYLIAALGYLTAGTVFQVIAFRAFSGLGTSMIFSVARAYVGDLTPGGHEGRWLGVFALADLLGFGTGPLIAGVIRDAVGFEAVFITMASLMGLAAVIVAFWLPRRPPIRDGARRTAGQPANVSFRDALRDRLVLALTVHATLVSLSSGMIFPFLSLRLERDIGASPTLVGLAFALQDVSAGLAQFAFGRVADRRDRRTLVGLGLFTLAALQATLGLAGTYVIAGVVLFAMGASNALAQVAGGAIQVVAGRRTGMGTVLGLTSCGNAAGVFTGSLVGGYIQGRHGLPASFITGAAGVAVGTAVFLALTRGLRTSEPGETARTAEVAEAAAAGA